MLVAKVAVLLERLVDDALQFGRDIGIQTNGGSRGTFENGVKDYSRRVTSERHGACGHLVENSAEGEQVGSGIELFSFRLLGRHISHRA